MLSLERFPISVFIFEKHCAIFFGKDLLAVLPAGFRESLIFHFICIGVQRLELSLQALSLFPHCKAAEVTSMEMSAC